MIYQSNGFPVIMFMAGDNQVRKGAQGLDEMLKQQQLCANHSKSKYVVIGYN